jgi:hypothetical protein
MMTRTTAEAPELGQIIADWRGDAAVLRRRGDERMAQALEQCADQAAEVADEFTAWLSVDEATRRSGWAHAKIVRHARLYLQTPHVRVEKRAYFLRACIVPRRQHLEMLREAAQRGVA